MFISVENNGMGDLFEFDVEWFYIFMEWYKFLMGSLCVIEFLDNWDEMVSKFVKVML